MDAVTHLAPTVGIVAACGSGGAPRFLLSAASGLGPALHRRRPSRRLPLSGRLPLAPSVRPSAPRSCSPP